jgi:hypothetical protein
VPFHRARFDIRLEPLRAARFEASRAGHPGRMLSSVLRPAAHSTGSMHCGWMSEGVALLYASLLAQARVGTSRHRVRMALK